MQNININVFFPSTDTIFNEGLEDQLLFSSLYSLFITGGNRENYSRWTQNHR